MFRPATRRITLPVCRGSARALWRADVGLTELVELAVVAEQDGVAGTDTLDGERLTSGADSDVCLVEAADSAANFEL
ncbi:hypothetical protein [Sorangium sp. So ce693]|uniref:hypothetical protein n=1 Tax=Sorangium sp. So ce693 TaxID=3133318 RepID=UPI003F60E838